MPIEAMIAAKIMQAVIFYIFAGKKKGYESRNILSSVPAFICLTVPLISIVISVIIYVLVTGGLDIPENVIFIVSAGFLL